MSVGLSILFFIVPIIFSAYGFFISSKWIRKIQDNEISHISCDLKALFKRVDELKEKDEEQGKTLATLIERVSDIKERIYRMEQRQNGKS